MNIKKQRPVLVMEQGGKKEVKKIKQVKEVKNSRRVENRNGTKPIYNI